MIAAHHERHGTGIFMILAQRKVHHRYWIDDAESTVLHVSDHADDFTLSFRGERNPKALPDWVLIGPELLGDRFIDWNGGLLGDRIGLLEIPAGDDRDPRCPDDPRR